MPGGPAIRRRCSDLPPRFAATKKLSASSSRRISLLSSIRAQERTPRWPARSTRISESFATSVGSSTKPKPSWTTFSERPASFGDEARRAGLHTFHRRQFSVLLDIFDPKAPPQAIGIDLGTTHSIVAALRDDVPQALVTCDGTGLLPSVVHYGKHGNIIVGAAARSYLTREPERTISSAKRFMG